MSKGVDILWEEGSICYGYGVDIPWEGVIILLVVRSLYHRYGGRYAMGRDRYSMGRGVDIPWVGDSIYHG